VVLLGFYFLSGWHVIRPTPMEKQQEVPRQLSEEVLTLDDDDGVDELWCRVPLELGWQADRLVLSSDAPFSLTRRGRQLWTGDASSVGRAQLCTVDGEMALRIDEYGAQFEIKASALARMMISWCEQCMLSVLYDWAAREPQARDLIYDISGDSWWRAQMPLDLQRQYNGYEETLYHLKMTGVSGAERMLQQYAQRAAQTAPKRTQWIVKGRGVGRAIKVYGCCVKVRNRTLEARRFTIGPHSKLCEPYGHFTVSCGGLLTIS
jgi:hypothetical protein